MLGRLPYSRTDVVAPGAQVGRVPTGADDDGAWAPTILESIPQPESIGRESCFGPWRDTTMALVDLHLSDE